MGSKMSNLEIATTAKIDVSLVCPKLVTKIVNSSAPNHKFYGNKHTLEALYRIRLAIQVKIDDKADITLEMDVAYYHMTQL